MRAFAHVLRQHGRRLVPLATSAAAADVLGRELGVRRRQPAQVPARVEPRAVRRPAARRRPGPGRRPDFALHPGDVVLVDEAGMAGTLLLDQLVRSPRRGARSSGCSAMTGSFRRVESGGALRLIAAQPGTPELTVLYRFRDPAEAAATLQLRTGDTAAVDWYAPARPDPVRLPRRDDPGRLRRVEGRHARREDHPDGRRHRMRRHRTVRPGPRRPGRGRAGRADGVELHDGNLAGTGDWIVTRDNDRRLSIARRPRLGQERRRLAASSAATPTGR